LIRGSYTLALEGATYEGSVAVLRGPEVVSERTLRTDDGGSPRAGRGEKLMPALAECLEEARVGRAAEHDPRRALERQAITARMRARARREPAPLEQAA